MKSQTLRNSVQVFFQIQSPNCGVNFSNNISITQVRVESRSLLILNSRYPPPCPLHDLIISDH